MPLCQEYSLAATRDHQGSTDDSCVRRDELPRRVRRWKEQHLRSRESKSHQPFQHSNLRPNQFGWRFRNLELRRARLEARRDQLGTQAVGRRGVLSRGWARHLAPNPRWSVDLLDRKNRDASQAPEGFHSGAMCSQTGHCTHRSKVQCVTRSVGFGPTFNDTRLSHASDDS